MAKKPGIPFVRISAPSIHYAVECAGARWAGVSELPRDQVSDNQLEKLKADQRLNVEEFEREPQPEGQAAA